MEGHRKTEKSPGFDRSHDLNWEVLSIDFHPSRPLTLEGLLLAEDFLAKCFPSLSIFVLCLPLLMIQDAIRGEALPNQNLAFASSYANANDIVACCFMCANERYSNLSSEVCIFLSLYLKSDSITKELG